MCIYIYIFKAPYTTPVISCLRCPFWAFVILQRRMQWISVLTFWGRMIKLIVWKLVVKPTIWDKILRCSNLGTKSTNLSICYILSVTSLTRNSSVIHRLFNLGESLKTYSSSPKKMVQFKNGSLRISIERLLTEVENSLGHEMKSLHLN